MYMVTNTQPNQTTLQLILHTVSDTPTKIMSKEYITHPKRLHLLHRPPTPHQGLPTQPDIPRRAQSEQTVWSPINTLFYSHNEDDSEAGYEDKNDEIPHLPYQADHPPPPINEQMIETVTESEDEQSINESETELT